MESCFPFLNKKVSWKYGIFVLGMKQIYEIHSQFIKLIENMWQIPKIVTTFSVGKVFASIRLK